MTRAVVLPAAGASVEVVEVELPALGPAEVRVRLAAAGVCHSDLSMVDGTMAPDFPLILGHEGSGVVVSVGRDVERLGPGDRVVFNWAASCGDCWYCARAEPWLCVAAAGVVARPAGSWRGRRMHAALGVGVFAEETIVHESAAVPVPRAVPHDVAALLGCAVLTGTGAVWRTSDVQPGESVCVVGLGGVGLCAIAAARIAGAARVVAVDLRADKEGIARRMGATDFVPGGRQTAREVRRLTEGRGADHSFECVGGAETIRLSWQATRRGGRCVVVGIGRRDDTVRFSAMELYHFNRDLTSSLYGSSDPVRDIPVLCELVGSGQLDVSPLITDRIGLDGVPAAFERMRHGIGVRSVIEFEPPAAA
jgi:S-(hydroxymethyl)glutathione dehydrogenase/alcohol dehydrogenase